MNPSAKTNGGPLDGTAGPRVESWLTVGLRAAAELVEGWKTIVGSVLVAILASIVLVLLLPQSYKSSVTLVMPHSETFGGGALQSLAKSELAGLVGASLSLGDGKATNLQVLLQSRALAMAANRKFSLAAHWKMKKRAVETVMKAWGKHFTTDISDDGAFILMYEDTDPRLTKSVLDFSVAWLDSAFQAGEREFAHKNRVFIEERLNHRVALMNATEDSMLRFQNANRSFVPSEQFKQSLLQGIGLEQDIAKLDIQIEAAKEMNGENSAEVRMLKMLRSKTASALNREMTGGGARKALIKDPQSSMRLSIEYARLVRQVQIHEAVYSFLAQQAEQLGFEGEKNVPVLSVVDDAYIPAIRSKPPRRAIVQAAALLALLASVTFVLIRGRVDGEGSPESEEWDRLKRAIRSVVPRRRLWPH